MVYNITKMFTRLFFKIIMRWKIYGEENIPKEGGVIIASNHTAVLDPLVIGSALDRKVHYLAKEELFKIKILSWFFKKLGSFPIKRGAGDRGAIRESLKFLEKGLALGIFPEGTRSETGKLQEAKLGAAMIAIKAGVPIVPVGLKGSKEGKNIVVNFGEPIYLNEYYGQKVKKEELDQISKNLMHKIAKLIEDK